MSGRKTVGVSTVVTFVWAFHNEIGEETMRPTLSFLLATVVLISFIPTTLAGGGSGSPGSASAPSALDIEVTEDESRVIYLRELELEALQAEVDAAIAEQEVAEKEEVLLELSWITIKQYSPEVVRTIFPGPAGEAGAMATRSMNTFLEILFRD